MKQKIYISLCLLAMVALTACGKKSQPPTVVVTPTPTPIATPIPIVTPKIPSPVTIAPTSPDSPPVVLFPMPAKVSIATPTPKVVKSIQPVAELPKSIYTTPTPVEIPVTRAPIKIAANPKPEPISKLNIPNPSQQITPVGIGDAKIGMSFKDLKEHMGKEFEFNIKTSFLEGFDAIAVTKSGTVQYYIPYPTGTQFTDTDRIQHLMTDNPNYRTEKGVGPGTPIKQAASVYGDATLSLSKENESREFINFTQHPNGLAFRPKPAKTRTFAGDYPESNEEYLKTEKYDKQAAIGQITVSCPDDQCEQEPSSNP